MDAKVCEKQPRFSRCSHALLTFSVIILFLVSWKLFTCHQHITRVALERQYADKPMYRTLPQSIIIGARKCGTRALLDFLDVHPQIKAAKGEVHFFDDPENFDKGLEWYRDQMPPAASGQITVEKSPAYFVTKEVPQRIFDMNRSTRLMLIVRDPVTRVVSDYAQLVHRRRLKGKPVKPLAQMVLERSSGKVNTKVKMIRTSLYYQHLSRWLELFPHSQIHLVDGDNLIRNPADEVRKVESFLQLTPYISHDFFTFNTTKGFYCVKHKGQEHCLGNGKGRRHPPVPAFLLRKLRQFYAPADKRLADMTGRTFNWMQQISYTHL